MSHCKPVDYQKLIPIFPLPNAVLLPGAVLPLHVFEKRYRKLTADALKDTRLLSVAVLRPSDESRYHTLHADIHPIVCLGRIIRDERLSDGRYNLLVQGLTRCRVLEEDKCIEYRRGRLSPIATPPLSPEVERLSRCRLRGALCESPLASLARRSWWIGLLGCTDVSLSHLLDILASVLLDCTEAKQSFLDEPHPVRRLERLLEAIRDLSRHSDVCEDAATVRTWPPRVFDN